MASSFQKVLPVQPTKEFHRVGIGCEQLGGHQWGNVNAEEISAAILEAMDYGITFFDTADCYGGGRSESLLGKTVRRRKRESIAISTKFGVRISQDGVVRYDNSEAWLDESLDGSLARLDTDYIDLYQVHYWDGNRPLEEIFLQLEDKRREGKIRNYGVSNIPIENLKHYPSGLSTFSWEYSLANSSREPFIKATTARTGCAFIAYGVLGQGVLTGKYGRNVNFQNDDRRANQRYLNFHGDKLSTNLAIVEKMKETSAYARGTSLSQIAIRWVLDTIPSSFALVGIKSRQQLRDVVTVKDWTLERSDLEILNSISKVLCVQN